MADELTQLQEQNAQQAAEIERLRGLLDDEGFGRRLRDVFSLAATAGTIATPTAHSELLHMIVRTAAEIISASGASLFVVDHQAGELVAERPLVPGPRQIEQIRLPLGHGIAGLVAATGQPIAIADATADPRHAADIAERIGYTPRSILCVPLIYNDEVIGVFELLDKKGAATFSRSDMELLGLIAQHAAVAVEQSRTIQSLAALIGEVLQLLPATGDLAVERVRQEARSFARRLEAEPSHRRALELARQVQEISRAGEAETAASAAILRSFAEYLRARPASLADFDMIR